MTDTGVDPADRGAFLHSGERLDDLQRDSLKIIQNPGWFSFGMDAVLLSAFAAPGVREEDACIDLCTGGGVIPLLMSARTRGKHFDGIEIMEDVADMASRSVAYNGLSDKITIRVGDVKNAAEIFGYSSFDIVTVNPPYLKEEAGLINPTSHKAAARHEIFLTLLDVIVAAKDLLVSGGHFYMVHRPFRLAEVLSEMVNSGVEPKRLRMVYPYADREPNMFLVEGVRGGRSGMVVMEPLVIYNGNGDYTDEVKKLYYS
ncbi:MAG: tRNA1(Val) (adenine(37)-N6)-methyltransferase [Eubacterium sp.]|nr:tRNA1(Val) (adenine(37)-N6)-methyltransferase [Eubacterium sp.]